LRTKKRGEKGSRKLNATRSGNTGANRCPKRGWGSIRTIVVFLGGGGKTRKTGPQEKSTPGSRVKCTKSEGLSRKGGRVHPRKRVSFFCCEKKKKKGEEEKEGKTA